MLKDRLENMGNPRERADVIHEQEMESLRLDSPGQGLLAELNEGGKDLQINGAMHRENKAQGSIA